MRYCGVLLLGLVACKVPRLKPAPAPAPVVAPAPQPNGTTPCATLARTNGNNDPEDRALLRDLLARYVPRRTATFEVQETPEPVLRVLAIRGCDDQSMHQALGARSTVGYAPGLLCSAYGFVAVECVPRVGAQVRFPIDQACTCLWSGQCACRW